MNKFLFCLLALIVMNGAFAQRLEIKESKKKLPDGSFEGITLVVDGQKDKVEELWLDELKSVGKVRKKRVHWEVTEAQIGNQVDLKLGTTVSMRNDSSISIWLGAKLKKGSKSVNQDVKEYLTAFGQEFYRSESREDLERTEEAAAFLSKKHQRLLNDNKKLAYELEEAVLEKERLEAALEKTALEIEVIKQKIENNTLDADATMIELEKTNQLLQRKKGALKKMN